MYRALRPLIFAMDAERAHRLTIAGLKALPYRPARFDPVLKQKLFGMAFPSPLGLAAGFDKDGEVPDAMLTLGFGFVEVGTVTPLPQVGNAKPRLFRLAEDRAVINRMGFNNRGEAALLDRLAGRPKRGIVGVNIGANKDSADRIADYAMGVRTMARVSDYLTVNISSPNTPGLRTLQAGGELGELLSAVAEARSPGGVPLFLKVAPDLEPGDHDRIVRAAIDHAVDALIVANTTGSRARRADCRGGR
jgi:dihydroorotate dehydrogenase